jgi:hypothetical protein
MPNSKESLRRSVRLPDPRDIALELARRAAPAKISRAAAPESDQTYPYVIHVSHPVTKLEELQLTMARVLGRPVAVMPHPCATAEEWTQRYARPPKP